jgi:hypothetical protein
MDGPFTVVAMVPFTVFTFGDTNFFSMSDVNQPVRRNGTPVNYSLEQALVVDGVEPVTT